ncbi:hypothetical protein B0O99DRAFT_116595 [Bisporella sp. PMI_857]|nr:hypothetical protein B0O99DRAFT_116595 [Bisporella sp. PMI_857]
MVMIYVSLCIELNRVVSCRLQAACSSASLSPCYIWHSDSISVEHITVCSIWRFVSGIIISTLTQIRNDIRGRIMGLKRIAQWLGLSQPMHNSASSLTQPDARWSSIEPILLPPDKSSAIASSLQTTKQKENDQNPASTSLIPCSKPLSHIGEDVALPALPTEIIDVILIFALNHEVKHCLQNRLILRGMYQNDYARYTRAAKRLCQISSKFLFLSRFHTKALLPYVKECVLPRLEEMRRKVSCWGEHSMNIEWNDPDMELVEGFSESKYFRDEFEKYASGFERLVEATERAVRSVSEI